MLKKVVILMLMVLYIYTLTFEIYLNAYFKFPTPIFGALLIIFFIDKGMRSLFNWEILFFILANLFYYAIAQADFKPFIINISVFTTCALYFNYFVGNNFTRFKTSLILFALCLGISTLIMFADHNYPEKIDLLRAKLIGGEIMQSPSGICISIFTFGYQIAAFTTFIFLYTFLSKKHVLLIIASLIVALLTIFYGMQRSVLVTFLTACILFLAFYYRAKSIPIIAGISIIAAVFFMVTSKFNSNSQTNILNKNTQNSENGEDRSGLITENLKVYADYPLGLIFYGKQWHDVTKTNPMFEGGLTSHNAYLMFFTYLGPIIGILLLIAIYYPIVKYFKIAIAKIRSPENAILASLCFAFLSISMNSLFHNAWLINANGPTVFLYCAILHLGKNNFTNKHINSKKYAVS